uniref:EF-hand domain-containing protein n=1 Tax=Haptolina brevifila TaxID=156173 RepID=A0A7S2MDC7_9EUKA|mmetsp:Transcript_49921/g.99376  ORF Transcript_49921/g.99376 Transcript_49921/m.99376 type:complete len:430 (+) Transcript_49921:79-1368(+)|eukprot:CAMPEP_0174694750 /NCGR_PEP_ID=MMETSP1094-20130205/1281_1 /TAXON_ID=156173 /ORGANISM="Chrysochromulina brevifilum, Strain UTEX LB 985" /LENGTH=429 /DNA_ID=CAMNT_0015891075 /DNA_START=79 /DNA_END=1368 /DNA_ORIENTATION=-
MSSSARYGAEVKVPPGAAGLLKDFTREVLRHQPSNDDFFAFGLDYFQQLLDREDSKGGIGHLGKDELLQVLDELFVEADTDGSGALSISEFKTVLKRADLGLSEKDALQLFAEVDMDASGEISYQEFIPLAVDMIQSMYARMDAAEMEEEALEDARQFLLHGMGKEQVMEIMLEMFRRADADGSGVLELKEFQKCLKDADIGLTKKEINILMAQCDVDNDGTISYEEFTLVAFDILAEMVKEQMFRRAPDELEDFVLAVWQDADQQSSGRLPVSVLSQALRSADLGLNRVQVHSVVGEAPVDDDGYADYVSFAPKAAGIIARLLNVDAQQQRYEAVQKIEEQMVPADFESALTAALEACDSEGTGFVRVLDLHNVLISNELPMQLTDVEINALLSCVTPDDAGFFYYPEFCEFALEILQYLQENNAVDF